VANITTSIVTEAIAKIAAHIPALKIPASAEQPAIRINKQVNINSANGFIQVYKNYKAKKLCRKFFQVYQ
jgi:hypothetical protein